MQFVYAIINFLMLFAIVYFAGRKAIGKIFTGRQERINKDLDEVGVPLPPAEPLEQSDKADGSAQDITLQEEISRREQELKTLDEKFEKDSRNMRLETLLAARAALVRETIENARSQMSSEQFHTALKEQEDKITDRILGMIRLTPGDTMYLKREGKLNVQLSSSEPLKAETVSRIRGAVDALLAEKGSKAEFSVVDNEEGLLGGFRLRLGDTVYDYTVNNRLYRLEEALNDMPLAETDSQSLLSSIKEAVGSIKIDVDVFQEGRVLSVSDGICWLDGLSDIMYGELVEFSEAKNKMRGMVMDVQPDKIGCIIFGNYEHVDSYSKVRRLGRMAEVPVGEELVGRVVNPIGEPIDGKGRIWSHESMPIECNAPAIPDRQPVNVPLETGIKAIDSLVPIGRGQRELIIGDRQTGKTAIAIDTIINQRDKGVYCIYVAIGQKETSVASIAEKLESLGAMDYTTIVCASASDSAAIQYIAPFAGTAMGEYFMHKGQDVLLIYDDLSKHAVAYRELSLLLHRPSGREAYPGDIFYLHSRLLERAARLSDAIGGGSLTALPIIETQAGDISAYIPTNVLSITDGQIFLEADLFNAGQRPAINVGLSVSRVGGSAQTKLMKQVSSNLRTSLAQYREYVTFTQFGSEVDEATRKTLHSGERMMAVLKQDRYEPMQTWQQALLIYAVSAGAFDSCEVEKVWYLEKKLLNWFRVVKPELCAELRKGDKLSAEAKAALDAALDEFGKAV